MATPQHRDDFNPRSPCGERHAPLMEANPEYVDFNPRSPCGERLYRHGGLAIRGAFQSTLPVRGATVTTKPMYACSVISIHAPRAGSDPFRGRGRRSAGYFNPRSPCGERRQASDTRRCGYRHFNPRSPCGERLVQLADKLVLYTFQSTLPVRGATDKVTYNGKRYVFQSTLPVRGATESGRSPSRRLVISIHAPRAGSDVRIRRSRRMRSFQSTLPVRGATPPRAAA